MRRNGPRGFLEGLAEAGEATEAGVELAVRAVAVKTPEHPVEAQFRFAGELRGQRKPDGAEPLGRDREQKRGDRLSFTGQIGKTFRDIFPTR